MGIAQMVERLLSMREVLGSIPGFSILSLLIAMNFCLQIIRKFSVLCARGTGIDTQILHFVFAYSK